MLLSIVTLIAMQVTVPQLGFWEPPDDTFFSVDPSDTDPNVNPWRTPADFIPVNRRNRYMDQLCVIWGRTAGVTKQCRSSTVRSVTPFESDGLVQNEFNEFQFHPMGTSLLGQALCHQIPFRPLECDFILNKDRPFVTYMDNAALDQCGAASCPNGIIRNAATGCDGGTCRQGAADALDMYTVAMHEIGHTLGITHPDCDGSSYDCPVIAQSGNRVSYWPQWDEVASIRDRWSTNARRIQFSIFNVTSTGNLTQTVSWTNLGTLSSEASPRISCSPSTSLASRSCIATTNTYGSTTLRSAPKFHSLNVSSTSVSVDSTVQSGTLAEGVVDIAYGTSNRYLALAKRPTDKSGATGVLVYSGAIASPMAQPTVVNLADYASPQYTHTEPRVSFHETEQVFVGAWPTKFGKVRIVTFSITGSVIDIASLDAFTVLPVEINCDSHLIGAITSCTAYVQPQSTEAEALSGRYRAYTIPIGSGGTITKNSSGIVSSGGFTWGTREAALLVDTATYGNGRLSTQVPGNAWLVTDDTFRSSGTNTIGVALHDANTHVTSRFATTLSMTDGQTNMTSWDWNEPAARFIVLRTGSSL